MSSVLTAPRRAPSGAARTPQARGRKLRVTADAALGLSLAGGLVLLAFVTGGGVDLAPNTWSEIALTTLGTALAAMVPVVHVPRRAWGAATLLLFSALAALTFASIAWSVQPANSWVEANRTLAYLAAFGGAMALARLSPTRWPAVVGAVSTLATVVSCYALLVKVFPATLDPTDPMGRLHAPFDYWNATGLLAAMGLPGCLWAGARGHGGRILGALAVPATGVLIAVLLLSYSRGALFAALVGLACWFALVPLRLRGALVLGLGAAGGGLVALWAVEKHPLTHEYASLSSRTSAGHEFGVVLLLALALLTIVGFVAAWAMHRSVLPATVRHRIGTALVSLVALVPVGGAAALTLSSRGLGGEVSHIWHTLTNPNSHITDNPGRLTELANSRPRYWREGLKVGEHALIGGAGAFGYATARTRYPGDPLPAQHAHSYVIQTFADLGLIGIVISLALLVAWALAAARTLGIGRSGRRMAVRAPPEHATEHAGLVTLLAVVVIFGVDSLIDWNWFIPGVAVTALICAGWLAGRGPLSQPVGRRGHASFPGAAAALTAGLACAVLAAWVIWQPLRSANADASAITALARGDARAALADARSAAAADPVSVDPLWELSAIYAATGDGHAARSELAKAVSLQPSNPATWLALGEYDLAHRAPQSAVRELEQAVQLDVRSPEGNRLLREARAVAGSGR